ncbi:MAG: adenylyltransferase/cytidyltransferase family protein [bacterium]|nr:adenylyltransferase/cytidyltransferase family protein [bacterium]
MLHLVSGRVMIFGTFDVFHPGHRFFIERAQEQGSELIVVVARDKTVKSLKPVLKNSEQVRLVAIRQAFPNVQVVLGDEEDPMRVVREYAPALVCLGYDQIGFSEQLQHAFPEIEVKRIEAFEPEKYKSSKM